MPAMSNNGLDVALAANAPGRFYDFISTLRQAGKTFFDSAFVHGHAVYGQVASGHLDGNLGYVLTAGPIAQTSKMDIHAWWQMQPHIGRC